MYHKYKSILYHLMNSLTTANYIQASLIDLKCIKKIGKYDFKNASEAK